MRPTELDRLETLLTHATAIQANLRHRRVQEALVDASHGILAEAGQRSLGDILETVCWAAKAMTGADCVLIYPLKPGTTSYEYEVENIRWVGLRSTDKLPSAKPRPKGVTARVLTEGILKVEDVKAYRGRFGSERLVNHKFIKREGIRAFVGVKLRDNITNEDVGALFIDYRRPRRFPQNDPRLRQAEVFASLASVAIHNARQAQQTQKRLAEAMDISQAGQEELTVLREVLEQALRGDIGGEQAPTSEERVIQALLDASQKLLGQPERRIGVLVRRWRMSDTPTGEPREMRAQYYPAPGGKLSCTEETANIYRGISGRALKTGDIQSADNVHDPDWIQHFDSSLGSEDTRSELDVPIKLGEQVIGVLNAESRSLNGFPLADQARLERLAAAAALALDNVRRQGHLRNVLDAARTMTAPMELKETLVAIKEAAQRAAPGLSAFTVWYLEPESKRIRLGPFFGVRNKAGMHREDPPRPESVVSKVMYGRESIFASETSREPRLWSRFAEQEGIASTAAFSFWADNEPVGAMFFNYREPHLFTEEEKTLFELFAGIAAANLRDAKHLEESRRKGRRLDAALDITEAVVTSSNLDGALPKIVRGLREHFREAVPYVLTYDVEARILEFAPASMEFYTIDNPDIASPTRLPLDGPGIVCRAARQALQSGEIEIIRQGDVLSDPDYLRHLMDTRSLLCATLMKGKELLGVVGVESVASNAFDEEDEGLIKGVAQQISLAIERSRQEAQLRFQTTVGAATAWAAEIAHDINRELGYIRNRAYWLQEDLRLPDRGKTYAAEIDASAERLAGTLSSTTFGEEVKSELVPIETILREWLDKWSKENAPGVHLVWDTQCPDVWVRVPSARLWRAVRHLARNAKEAMSGKGTLTLRTRRVNEKTVEVQIEDRGPGIPEPIRATILRDRSTSKGPGHGFGLLLVRLLIEQMGGSIRLLPPQVGKGTTFAFQLPVEDAKEERPNATDQES